MKQVHQLLLAGAVLLLLIACKGRKQLADERPVRLPDRNATELVQALVRNAGRMPHTLNAKADVRLNTDGRTRSTKAHVRLVCDSAAWFSVMPALGIEMARVLLLQDSLKMIDKLNDGFWVGDSAQAAVRFGVPIDLRLVQDALLGHAIGLEPDAKYRVAGNEGLYVLYTKGARRMARMAGEWEGPDSLEIATGEDLVVQDTHLPQRGRKETSLVYWIDPDSLWVDRVLIERPAYDQQVDVRYMDRKWVDGTSVPTRITLSLSAAGQASSAAVQLDRIRINAPIELPFRIPPKFTPMD